MQKYILQYHEVLQMEQYASSSLPFMHSHLSNLRFKGNDLVFCQRNSTVLMSHLVLVYIYQQW